MARADTLRGIIATLFMVLPCGSSTALRSGAGSHLCNAAGRTRPARVSSWNWTRVGKDPNPSLSPESKCDQARPEHRRAHRCQGEESARKHVLMLHRPPPAFDRLSNALSCSKSTALKLQRPSRSSRKPDSLASLPIRRANERLQTHEPGRYRRQPSPSLPSLLRSSQNVLLRPARRKRRAPPHSQNDSGPAK